MDTVTSMSGLRYIDILEGTGPVVTRGSTVTVDYAGYLLDGTLFDTSVEDIARNYDLNGRPLSSDGGTSTARRHFDRGGYPFQPYKVENIGSASVIAGWNEGLVGMRVGGHRRLIVPPALGYGATGTPSIPPNSTLVFDIWPRSIEGAPQSVPRR
jgi:FKBP-type peptidyl-prolyl cis-trans isomerase